MEKPKSLDEMKLEELIASLPLPPLDPNDPDPIMRMIAAQELGKTPDSTVPPSTDTAS